MPKALTNATREVWKLFLLSAQIEKSLQKGTKRKSFLNSFSALRFNIIWWTVGFQTRQKVKLLTIVSLMWDNFPNSFNLIGLKSKVLEVAQAATRTIVNFLYKWDDQNCASLVFGVVFVLHCEWCSHESNQCDMFNFWSKNCLLSVLLVYWC